MKKLLILATVFTLACSAGAANSSKATLSDLTKVYNKPKSNSSGKVYLLNGLLIYKTFTETYDSNTNSYTTRTNTRSEALQFLEYPKKKKVTFKSSYCFKYQRIGSHKYCSKTKTYKRKVEVSVPHVLEKHYNGYALQPSDQAYNSYASTSTYNGSSLNNAKAKVKKLITKYKADLEKS